MKVVRVPGDGARQLELALKGLQGKVGKVGWFKNARYPDPPNVQVAYVATIQEYGYPAGNIPPRPFVRPTMIAKQQEWTDIALKGAKAVLNGKSTVDKVMEALGLKAAGDIRKAISAVYSPALAESTILARLRKNKNTSKLKGRLSEKQIGNLTKPLIDTGHMFVTLTNVVEDE